MEIMEFLLFILVWLPLSVVTGIVAHRRHRFGFGYFLLSLVVSPVMGLLLAALLPPKISPGFSLATRQCPECAEFVMAAAIKCKHCGSSLPPLLISRELPPPVQHRSLAGKIVAGVGLTAFGFLVLTSWYGRSGTIYAKPKLVRPAYSDALAKTLCKAQIIKEFDVVEWIDESHWRVDWPDDISRVVTARVLGNSPSMPRSDLNISCYLETSPQDSSWGVIELMAK